jgi:1-acyl-sn-glycerol-3-phosphate acyltransferase
MFEEIIKLFLNIYNIKLEIEINNDFDKFNSIVVSNHISELDPFILFLIFSENNMKYRFISDNKIKHIPFFGIIADYFNTIYIDRTNPSEALYELNKNINSNDNICIFPEGTMYYKKMIEKRDRKSVV